MRQLAGGNQRRRIRVCTSVVVCVSYPSDNLSGINNDLVGSRSPHRDQRLIIMQINLLCEFLDKVWLRMQSM